MPSKKPAAEASSLPASDTPEENAIEAITLPAGGSIPGIPGLHGAGTYLVNWLERTATPVVINIEGWVERMIEGSQSASAQKETPANTSEQTN